MTKALRRVPDRRSRRETLAQLEQAAGWTTTDAEVLARHADLFRAKAESMVDSRRAVIGSQPHLSQPFLKSDGAPDDGYKASVKRRFVQWVISPGRENFLRHLRGACVDGARDRWLHSCLASPPANFFILRDHILN